MMCSRGLLRFANEVTSQLIKHKVLPHLALCLQPEGTVEHVTPETNIRKTADIN